jgi:hypothetical protein
VLGEQGKLLIERLRQTFYNFIFTFPELTSHDFFFASITSEIYISALKKNIIAL